MKTRGFAFLVLSSALVAVASAALLPNTMPVPRGPEGRTHHYKPIGKPLPTDEHQITLALKQRNMDVVKQLVEEISDPTHPSYGNYLSRDAVTALVAPSFQDVDAVATSLRMHGARDIDVHANRDVIRATLSTRSVEAMFGVTLETFRHAVTGRVITRSAEVHSLPSDIADIVDLVHGVSDFPVAMRRQKRTTESALAGALQKASMSHHAAATSTAPIVVACVPYRDGMSAVVLQIVCQDGSIANTVPPCSGSGAIADNITTAVSTSFAGDSAVTTNTSPLGTSCTLQGNATSCVHFFKTPTDYAYYNVNVSITFSDGNKSAVGVSPYAAVTTPIVMPQNLDSLYSIPPNTIATNTSLSQAVGEFEQQYFSMSDLDMFLRDSGIVSAPVTVIGPNNASQPGGEASLDIEFIMAMGRGVATTFWSIQQPSTAPVDHILEYCYQVGNATNPPLVHSLSYGMAAANVDTYQGAGYLERSDNELAKLALRGLTIIIASGDAGVGLIGPAPQEVPNCDVFHPDWPSISPYVTAVGSTYITPIAEKACFASESIGAPDCTTNPLSEVLLSTDTGMPWTATGGFSFSTATPSYQKDVVEAYLTTHKDILPPAHLFNASGRAFPDVVTVGHNLNVVLGGKFVPTDGTSASAPIFAGIVSLLNQARASAGMPMLGFANPLLYHIAKMEPSAFRDITVGNNKCSSQGFCCEAGFEATVGFDPATGLGSPNYSVLEGAVNKYVGPSSSSSGKH